MRYLISGAGLIGAVVLMAASGSMNVMFWLNQGQSAREADILASVSVAFDIFKSVLPFCIAWAWAGGKRGYVTAGSALFVLFFCFSLMSAIGFAAGNRNAVTGGREAQALRLEASESALQQAKSELKGLPAHRFVAVIDEELKGMRLDRFWTGSQNCTQPSGGVAIAFCRRYADRMTEKAAAVTSDGLGIRIAELTQQIERLKEQGAGQGGDVQIALVAAVSGLDNDRAKTAIIVFVAVLVELGAAFGLFLALGHSFNHGHGAASQTALETTGAKQVTVSRLLSGHGAPSPQSAAIKPLRLRFADGGMLSISEGSDHDG
jgi:hypothetical protein